MNLSAVVITRNEERNIRRCLASLSFCNDIVVVDAESTDRTRELAAEFTPQVHVRPWTGYSDQKNFGVSLAKCAWVLSIDADEEVSEELRYELQRLLDSTPSSTAFTIPRRTLHSGRWIRYGGWYPNRLLRLFRRDKGKWVGADVHERWEAEGAVGSLQADLIHYSFSSIADQVDRNNRYSTLGAAALQRQGKRFSISRQIIKSAAKFLETYLWKLGFLDGYPGFVISVSASYSVFLKWSKLWELEFGSEKKS